MQITTNKVLEFLQAKSKKNIRKVTSIGNGEWSQAFFFNEDNITKVIRFSNIDEDFKRDEYAYRYNSDNLPIPKIEEIGNAFGGYYAISKKVEGDMIDNLSPTDIQSIISPLYNLFDAMRTTDTSKSYGYGAWDINGNGENKTWKEFLISIKDNSPSSRLGGWEQKLNSRKKDKEIFGDAYQQLHLLVDKCPEERNIIHSDLLHYNLLIKKNKISAVIDWGCAKYGDFLYDISWFIFWQFWYPSMNNINFKEYTLEYFKMKKASLENFEERIKCYQLNIGLDSMVYCSYKENWKNLGIVSERVSKLLN